MIISVVYLLVRCLLGRLMMPDGRVMFVDDGHRASRELVEGPGSSMIQRQVRDGRRFRAVKVT